MQVEYEYPKTKKVKSIIKSCKCCGLTFEVAPYQEYMKFCSKSCSSQGRKHPFFRYCKDCGKRFQPTGKKNVYCQKCIKRHYKEGQTKRNKRRKKLKNEEKN